MYIKDNIHLFRAFTFSRLLNIFKLYLSFIFSRITKTPNTTKEGVPMNKNDLVSDVAESAGLTKADAGRAVDAVFESIQGALKSGGDVRIVGFGTFSFAHRAATTGRNPRTGETIQIKASKQPKFKAGAPLKEAVNS